LEEESFGGTKADEREEEGGRGKKSLWSCGGELENVEDERLKMKEPREKQGDEDSKVAVKKVTSEWNQVNGQDLASQRR